MKTILLSILTLFLPMGLYSGVVPEAKFIRDTGTYQLAPGITLTISTDPSGIFQFEYQANVNASGSNSRSTRTSNSLFTQRGQPILFYYDDSSGRLWIATPNGVNIQAPNSSTGYVWGSILPDGVPISAETIAMMHLPPAPTPFKDEVKRIFNKSPIP